MLCGSSRGAATGRRIPAGGRLAGRNARRLTVRRRFVACAAAECHQGQRGDCRQHCRRGTLHAHTTLAGLGIGWLSGGWLSGGTALQIGSQLLEARGSGSKPFNGGAAGAGDHFIGNEALQMFQLGLERFAKIFKVCHGFSLACLPNRISGIIGGRDSSRKETDCLSHHECAGKWIEHVNGSPAFLAGSRRRPGRSFARHADNWLARRRRAATSAARA